MKRHPRVIFAAVAFLAAAYSLPGQQEQWLRYRTLREPRSYRLLEVKTNAPAGVALPKLSGPMYFGSWATPLDPSGKRWVCLGSSGKGALCDRLVVDANGNGKLDDDPVVNATGTEDYTASFPSARLTFRGEDGPLTYHLLVQFSKYDDNQHQVLISPGGVYEGKVDFGGKKLPITLVDANVNGLFDDRSSKATDCDRIAWDSEGTEERIVGKLLEVEKQLYRIEVARDGAFIKVEKAQDVVLGKVRIPEAISEFVVFGENGHFRRKSAQGEFTVPVGKYSVDEWTIERKDARNATWQMSGYRFPEKATFEVVADKPITLEVAEPILTTMRARETKTEVQFNLEFRGRMGESIQFRKGMQQLPGPRLTLASIDGQYRHTNTFEFG